MSVTTQAIYLAMKRGFRNASLFVIIALFASAASAPPAASAPWWSASSHNIAKASLLNATIDTVAGVGVAEYTGDGQPALQASLNFPQDVEHFGERGLLITDTNNHRVRLIDFETGQINAFAGNGLAVAGGNQFPATEASVAFPRGLAAAEDGSVFIASEHQIRRVRPDGIIELYAGSVSGDDADGVSALEARFRTLGGLAVDLDGGIIAADIINHKIRKIRPDGVAVTLAGTGAQGASGDAGPAHLASLNGPVDVAVHSSGDIYIAERLGNRIRVIRDGFIYTLYSSNIDPNFFGPRGLAIQDDVFLYFSSDDHVVRRINLITLAMEVVVGTSIGGFAGDNGPALQARINSPVGLTINQNGRLFIADSFNNRIRRVHLPEIDIPDDLPTPTPTFFQTPTPTITATPTPSRTPRPRTPIPTQTVIPTFTPTATPTPFPQGQLAPDISTGISPRENYVFFTNRTQVNVPFHPNTGRSKILLSSTPDGTGNLLTRDTIGLSVERPSGLIERATVTFNNLGTPIEPQDISHLFEQGVHTVQVRLIDSKGTGFASRALYLAVFTAPVLNRLPDIRALIGEEIIDAYNLNDFIYDQDTPLEDIEWSIESSPEGPAIVLDDENWISVEPSLNPTEKRFLVRASDGVFEASQEVVVKVSSFRVDPFILPNAPLLEDFAYRSPFNLHMETDPPGVNLANVPFEATFTAGRGLRAAHAARGEIILVPEFPGGGVREPLIVSYHGKRLSNPMDFDGVVQQTASVFAPIGGRALQTYNFSASALSQTQWMHTAPNGNSGEVFLGPIPEESIPGITDGYGATVVIEPGQISTLLSAPIELPPGPAMISLWFAVDKLEGDLEDKPTVMLALAEDSSNLSLTSVTGDEMIGEGVYQYLAATYDVIGPRTRALIQVIGSQESGAAEVYFDNVRVYPAKRDIDMALGATQLPVDFDGTFERVLRGLGALVAINPNATFGGSARLTQRINRTIFPGGLNQSLILSLDEPISAIQVEIGPNPVDEDLYPSNLSARAYVQKIEDGGGFFAIGLTNGDHLAVTFISNDRIPASPAWREITATGLFYSPGQYEPTILLQNQNIEGAVPGVILDGAILAIDDVTLEAFLDEPYLWDRRLLPRR